MKRPFSKITAAVALPASLFLGYEMYKAVENHETTSSIAYGTTALMLGSLAVTAIANLISPLERTETQEVPHSVVE